MQTMAVDYPLVDFDAVTYNQYVETLRKTEYCNLQNTTYLDHAGTTLYAKSLLDAFHSDLTSNLFGNPHSISPASNLSTQRVQEARVAVLEYFNADHDSFDVIFTSNASAAVKLVADCFREQDFDYYYHKDTHSSIVGVRELARGSKCLVSNEDVEDFISHANTSTDLKLFAYPAQSNMTGYRPPLSWSGQIRKKCKNTYVLLDAASYLTTARLNLTDVETSPDFIALSFYKIFGFPTGLGALIVRNASSEILKQRRYFGGGTVDQITVIGGQTHAVKETSLHDRLEDGTLAFHLIASLKYAVDVQTRLFKSGAFISAHCANIVRWLYESMNSLRHKDGSRVVELHKEPAATYGNPASQGPIVAFSVLRSDGTYVGKSHFERLANGCGFQIRTGGVCNPGGIASMLRLQHWEMHRNWLEGVRCGDDIDVVGSKPTGIIRVSLGPMSTMSDVKRFIGFLEKFFIDNSTTTQPVKKDVAGIIKPVRGCAGFRVEPEIYMAFQTWNNQWCLISPDSRRPVDSITYDIKVRIDVQSETLVFDDEFEMSLWEMPPVSEIQTVSANERRKWDLYDGPINEWLSAKLERPCLMARYRALDIKERPETLTCVVAGCYSRKTSIDELRQHYQTHAQFFLKEHPFIPQVEHVSNDRSVGVTAHLVEQDLGAIERSKVAPADFAAKDFGAFLAKLEIIPTTTSVKQAAFYDLDASKLSPTEKKQRWDSIRRMFRRSAV